jgi:DNA-binding GntR family transcriptional regulator
VKRSLADDVVDRLRDAIFHGSFKPGEALREEQLAAMLDVSRGPVREALVQLEREGLVLVRRHRGATVARLSRSDLEDVYSLQCCRPLMSRSRVAHPKKRSPSLMFVFTI